MVIWNTIHICIHTYVYLDLENIIFIQKWIYNYDLYKEREDSVATDIDIESKQITCYFSKVRLLIN